MAIRAPDGANNDLHISEEFVANDQVHPGTTHFVNNYIKVSTNDNICARVRVPVQGESSALRF